ncbi:MAG TPA: DUF3108 domain-containing protein [Luteimonas sp.]|nr:DUF3108 domain-containing protein [Luteimonas sp.]
MKSLLSIMALALLPLASIASAEELQPFVAAYQVSNGGRELGDATMQVVHVDGARWRVDLGMKGRGLMRLTGLNVQQSTVFDSNGHDYRPLTQSTVKRAFLSSKKSVGVYDWNARSARWTGDVKKTRTGSIALQVGDMSGLLIDLAVIRDAVPGQTLHYRFVDDGRVREHTWAVAPQTENISVGDLSYDAMRVERIQDGSDETILWVASGVPTPIRILQREDGQDTTDLRLIEYKGAPQ